MPMARNHASSSGCIGAAPVKDVDVPVRADLDAGHGAEHQAARQLRPVLDDAVRWGDYAGLAMRHRATDQQHSDRCRARTRATRMRHDRPSFLSQRFRRYVSRGLNGMSIRFSRVSTAAL